MLESVEALAVTSLIPIALLLHKLNRESPISLSLTIAGILAIVGGAAITIGFVTELAAFGEGFIGGRAYWVCEVTVGIWLLGANAIAWRARIVPWGAMPLALLLYPVWAVPLTRWLKKTDARYSGTA